MSYWSQLPAEVRLELVRTVWDKLHSTIGAKPEGLSREATLLVEHVVNRTIGAWTESQWEAFKARLDAGEPAPIAGKDGAPEIDLEQLPTPKPPSSGSA